MTMRGLVLLVLALALAAPLLLLSACGGGSKEEVTYVIADAGGDWGYPSPYAHYSRGPGYIRMSFIFDTLVWKDEGGVIPALAESWEYSKVDNAYTFNLRDDVSWHDGNGFSADDVVFTFEYTKQHPFRWVDSRIVRAAEALDEYTVKLYLEEPYAPFLNDVAGTQPILPKHIWEGVEEPELFAGTDAVVGTGPFVLEDYSREQGSYLYTAYEG